jgi:gluconokinase
MIVVVMGVSGSGKTTVGGALAGMLGWEFLDADEFHPPANVAKMAAGTPLEDEDRSPWLERLNRELLAREAGGKSAVLACSALKEAYREKLMCGLNEAQLVYLRGTIGAIRQRMATRKHRYMPASLLESQFATLEPPKKALEVDAQLTVEEAVRRISAALLRTDPPRTP